MAEDQQVDGAQLWQTILDDAGIDNLSEVPVATSCRWFPIAGARDFSIWEVGKPVPVNAELVVFAIFQTETDIKVYACSLSKAGKTPKPPHRVTLSKTAPTLLVEVIAFDTFIGEVAKDLQDLTGGPDVDMALLLAEAIREALAAPDANTAADLLQKALAEYDDEEAGDDDADEEVNETNEETPEETKPPPNGEVTA